MRCTVALVLCATVAGAAKAQSVAERAEGGNSAAQFELGMRSDLGNGVPADAHVAFAWFRRAAEAGLPEAEFNVGAMLDSGRGTAPDATEAALWYARSAAHGNHRAQFNLGLLYAAGEGVPRNPDLAAFWFRRASAAIPLANRRLAELRSVSRDGATLVTAATPAAPRGRITAGSTFVEFVWTAPMQPEPVRYQIEVRALDEAGSWEVYSGIVAGSATLASLREISGNYAWRVFTLAPLAGQYRASEWTAFTVPPQSSEP